MTNLDLFEAVTYYIERQLVLELGDCFYQKGTQYANDNPNEDQIAMWILNWSGRGISSTNNRVWKLLVQKQAEINKLQQDIIELNNEQKF